MLRLHQVTDEVLAVFVIAFLTLKVLQCILNMAYHSFILIDLVDNAFYSCYQCVLLLLEN